MISAVSLWLLYLIFRHLLGLLLLLGRTSSTKDRELLVLRHELAVLCRTNPKPRLNWADRAVFAALVRRRPRALAGHHGAAQMSVITRRVLVRRRPAAADLPAHEALVHKPRSPSFPSAHAAVAAAFTTALACRIGPAGLGVAPVPGPSPTRGCVLGRIGLLTSQSASSRACSWERPCTGR
jgi:membrane-associated phospholipid phosphatase